MFFLRDMKYCPRKASDRPQMPTALVLTRNIGGKWPGDCKIALLVALAGPELTNIRLAKTTNLSVTADPTW